MDAFLGTILPWPGTYAPAGWAFCDGSPLQVSQYPALFAVISNQFGGDGRTTFKLPDLRGRTILGTNGQTPLTSRAIAATGGAEQASVVATGTANVALTTANLPAHAHPATLSMSGLTATTKISVSTGTNGQLNAVQDAVLSSTAGGSSGAAVYLAPPNAPAAPVTLGGVSTTVTGSGSVTVGNTGGGTPFPVTVNVPVAAPTLPPFLVLNYIICLEGLFPPHP